MNRALRRHQLKEARSPKGTRAGTGAMSRTGPARPAPQRETRGGLLGWRPRWAMDIISELKKVTWPTREDTMHLTVVVVIVTILIGAVLGAIDIGFGWLIDQTLLK